MPASSEIRIRPERIPTALRDQWDGESLSDVSSDDPSSGSIEPLDSLIDLLARRWGDHVVLADGVPESSETSPSSPGATYTGSELVKQCDQLADSIASACPEGGVVAIDMPKSAAQAIAVLASLRAHRPFVVIDDDAPQDRRSFIMKDSAAAAVVTRLDDVQPVEHHDGKQVTDQDVSPHNPANESGEAESSDDLAYIVYTSGTTGLPKGVNVSRHAVEHLIAGHRAQLFPETLDHVANTQPQASAALAHTASFAFDAAIDQLSWIFAGVRVVIYNRSTVTDGEAFHRCLRRDDITMIDATPSLFGALLASGVPLLDARKSHCARRRTHAAAAVGPGGRSQARRRLEHVRSVGSDRRRVVRTNHTRRGDGGLARARHVASHLRRLRRDRSPWRRRRIVADGGADRAGIQE